MNEFFKTKIIPTIVITDVLMFAGKRQNAESKLEINAVKTDGGQRYECRVINSAMSSPRAVPATLKVLCKQLITEL